MDATEPRDDDLLALQDAREDRDEVLASVLECHRARLVRMVEIRMHPALRGRIGASDVLQDAWLDISTRLGEYLLAPRIPFFLWIRFLTAQRLVALHRRHLGAKMRDARREVSLAPGAFPRASTVALADRLALLQTTPSQAAMRDEMRLQLVDALDRMNEIDREVLVLRQIEELSNAEVATELGIEKKAASKRYLRALKRLRVILEDAGIQADGGVS